MLSYDHSHDESLHSSGDASSSRSRASSCRCLKHHQQALQLLNVTNIDSQHAKEHKCRIGMHLDPMICSFKVLTRLNQYSILQTLSVWVWQFMLIRLLSVKPMTTR